MLSANFNSCGIARFPGFFKENLQLHNSTSLVHIWKDSCFVFWVQKNCIFTTAHISVYNCTKFFTTAQSVHNCTLKNPGGSLATARLSCSSVVVALRLYSVGYFTALTWAHHMSQASLSNHVCISKVVHSSLIIHVAAHSHNNTRAERSVLICLSALNSTSVIFVRR